MKSWKKFNSKDFTKEYLQDKTITLIINEKISNKKQEFALLLNHGWLKGVHQNQNLQEYLQEYIKKLFDSEFKFFKSICEDLVIKSDAMLNSQIKHLLEKLRSKDEIINQTLAFIK